MDFLTKPPTWLTEHLPPEVNDVLHGGGWYVVLGVAGLLVLLFLIRVVRALLPRSRPAAAPAARNELEENLAAYPPLRHASGAKRLTFDGVPVRVRLVVLAPAGIDLQVNPETVEQLLNQVVPGLGATATADRAATRIWPNQLSHQAFSTIFFRNVRRPEGAGEPSHWVLLAGRAKVAQAQVLIGLALYADEATTLDRQTLEPHAWATLLRVRARPT